MSSMLPHDNLDVIIMHTIVLVLLEHDVCRLTHCPSNQILQARLPYENPPSKPCWMPRCARNLSSYVSLAAALV